jgi:predicted dehydrogenase
MLSQSRSVARVSVRFGVVGTGYWAEEIHAAGTVAHPSTELVAVWGRDAAKAGALAGRRGIDSVGSFDELLERVDALAFAVPPDVQAELAPKAASAGKHLLLEKPLATNVDAADRVVAAVEDGGAAALVFFTGRFAPPTAAWFRDVVEHGGWDGGQATWLAALDVPGSPFRESPWRWEKGALWDVGPHALASLVPALGPVERVVAVRGRRDTVQLALGHADGGSSVATLSLTASPAAALVETRIWGPSGIAVMPDRGAPADAYAVALTELVRMIETGERENPLDVRFGREVVNVLAEAEAQLAGH